jgi:hypothetical protein
MFHFRGKLQITTLKRLATRNIKHARTKLKKARAPVAIVHAVGESREQNARGKRVLQMLRTRSEESCAGILVPKSWRRADEDPARDSIPSSCVLAPVSRCPNGDSSNFALRQRERGRKQLVAFERNLSPSQKHEGFVTSQPPSVTNHPRANFGTYPMRREFEVFWNAPQANSACFPGRRPAQCDKRGELWSSESRFPNVFHKSKIHPTAVQTRRTLAPAADSALPVLLASATIRDPPYVRPYQPGTFSGPSRAGKPGVLRKLL